MKIINFILPMIFISCAITDVAYFAKHGNFTTSPYELYLSKEGNQEKEIEVEYSRHEGNKEYVEISIYKHSCPDSITLDDKNCGIISENKSCTFKVIYTPKDDSESVDCELLINGNSSYQSFFEIKTILADKEI